METYLARLAGIVLLAMIVAVPARATLTDRGHYGVVVDAGTSQSIGDVKVNVVWNAGYASLGHSGERCVKMMVVDTDSEGRFSLPAWKLDGQEATGFYLVAHAYKPGYRAVELVILSSRDTWMRRLKGSDSLELEAKPLRVEMRRESEGPEVRVQYLLTLWPASACKSYGKAEIGAPHYHFLRAIYEEARTYPPMSAGARASHVDFMRESLARSRQVLIRVDPEQAKLTEDTAPPPVRGRDIALPPPTARRQMSKPDPKR